MASAWQAWRCVCSSTAVWWWQRSRRSANTVVLDGKLTVVQHSNCREAGYVPLAAKAAKVPEADAVAMMVVNDGEGSNGASSVC